MKSVSLLISAFMAVATLTLAAPATRVSAHSWVACSDYRGDAYKYDYSACKSYPRNFFNMRGRKDSGFGEQQGFNYNGGDACQAKGRSNNPDEIAKYEQGGVYCLAWMPQNHVASAKNIYLPDTGTKVFLSTDPDSGFTKELQTNFGQHTKNQVDCLGFQRIPEFGNNPVQALGTGCFHIPKDQPLGDVSLQWHWEFNSAAELYKTCFDATIIPSSGAKPSIPLTNYPKLSQGDTLGAGGQTCSTNWAQQDQIFYNSIGGAPNAGSNQQQQQQAAPQPTTQPQPQAPAQSSNSNGSTQTVAQRLTARITNLEAILSSQAKVIQDLIQQVKALQA